MVSTLSLRPLSHARCTAGWRPVSLVWPAYALAAVVVGIFVHGGRLALTSVHAHGGNAALSTMRLVDSLATVSQVDWTQSCNQSQIKAQLTILRIPVSNQQRRRQS